MNLDADTDPYPAALAATVLAGLRVAVQRWLETPPSRNKQSLTEAVDAVITRLAEGFDTK